MSFPPATKIVVGVRTEDIAVIEGMKSRIQSELANQIIAEGAIVFVENTPFKIMEVLPSSPAVITRLTHLSLRSEDFIPPEDTSSPLKAAEIHTADTPPEAESTEKPGQPRFPPASKITLGVNIRDIPTIERDADILLEELNGTFITPRKTVYFKEVPLLVLDLDPAVPSIITRHTKLSFTEEEFIAEDAPPPKAFETKQALYLALFLTIGIVLFFVIYYAYTVFAGRDTFKVRYAVKIPRTMPIRQQILEQQAEILKKRLKNCGLSGTVEVKPYDQLEVSLRNYETEYESVILARGEISFRYYEKSGYTDNWKSFLSQIAIKEAEVKEGQTGLPEITFELPEISVSKFQSAFEKIPNAPVSVFLDGAKISGPLVKEELKRGVGVIRTKELTKENARNIVIIMNSGTYPFPMEMVK